MSRVGVMYDYGLMLDAYAQAGGTPEVFKDSKVSHLIVHGNKVIGSHLVDGLVLEPVETESGVQVRLIVKKGVRIERPVHLFFGVMPEEGVQEILMHIELQDGSGLDLLAYYVFPNAVKVLHRMDAEIDVGNDASCAYNEVHFHGENGGIEVIPRAKIQIGHNSRLVTHFALLRGRVGRLDMDYDAQVLDGSSLEMTARVYGSGSDQIRIREAARLLGERARCLIKSRIAVKGEAKSEVYNELTASARGAQGHMDCVEIVQGQAEATAVPTVGVTHELAKVTHTAAIGRVDQKQVKALMAKGLEEERAIDLVIGGMLK
jgi:Fe-S cluster assembly scaffold protein SufB